MFPLKSNEDVEKELHRVPTADFLDKMERGECARYGCKNPVDSCGLCKEHLEEDAA